MRERNLETETNFNVIISDMITDYLERLAETPNEMEGGEDECELYIFSRLLNECGLSVDTANHVLDTFENQRD